MLFPVSLSTRLPIAMISLVSEAFTDKTMSGLVPIGNMSFMVKFLLLPRCTLGSINIIIVSRLDSYDLMSIQEVAGLDLRGPPTPYIFVL